LENIDQWLKYVDGQYVEFTGLLNPAYSIGLSFLYNTNLFHYFLLNNISMSLETHNDSYVVNYKKSTGHLYVVYNRVAYLKKSNFQFPHVTKFIIKAKYVLLYDDFFDIFPNLVTFNIQTNGRGLCRNTIDSMADKYNVNIKVNNYWT
jgi:hypothetical protein